MKDVTTVEAKRASASFGVWHARCPWQEKDSERGSILLRVDIPRFFCGACGRSGRVAGVAYADGLNALATLVLEARP